MIMGASVMAEPKAAANAWLAWADAILEDRKKQSLFANLANNGEVSDGTWGYSSPNHMHIVFCADDGRTNEMRSALIAAQRWAIMGEGVYKNEAPEPCFILRADDFYNLLPYIRDYMQDQESVLRLGHLKAQNWRDAHLIYGSQHADGPDVRTVCVEDARCVFAGTFMAVTEEVAKAQTGYTKVHGHYYTVILNPPRNMEESRERAITQLMADAYLELAARNRKYRDKHGLWRKSTIAVTGRLYAAMNGQVLENGKTLDDEWFQDELRITREAAVH